MTKFVGIGKETTYGTAVTRTKFWDIVTESMNPDQGYIDPETAAYLEPGYRIPGGYVISGDIEMLCDADSILEVLAATCFHEPTPQTVVTGVYSWTFKPQNNPFSVTLEIAPDVPAANPKSRVLAGTVLKSLTIEAAARELVTVTVGGHAAKDSLQDTPSTPTFSTRRPFVFYEGTLESPQGTQLARVESFSMTMETTIPEDVHTLGSRFLQFMHIGGRSVTGSMDVAFLDWSLFQRFWGSATATGPQTEITPTSIVLDLQGETLSGTHKAELKITLPKVYFDTTNANIDRRERIIQSIDFTAIYDSSAQAAVEFFVKTSRNTLWS